MSRKQRKPYTGCSIESYRERLRLRYRLTTPDGKTKHIARATGRADTPENREALESLAEVVGKVIAAGKDPTPVLDAYLAGQGSASVSPPPPSGCETVTSFFEQWIAYQTPPLVRKAQARDYRRHLAGYVIPRLGSIPLAELRSSDVLGLRAELVSRGLSVKYVKNIFASFRAMVQQAIVDERLDRDPFARMKWGRWNPPEPDPLTPEQRSAILRWFQEKRFSFHAGTVNEGPRFRPHPPYHGYVHFLFWEGVRPSEASGLQLQDVDLELGLAHIRRSWHLYEYNEPKTRTARRTIQLFPETVRFLKAIQPLRAAPDTPVFRNTEGKPIEPKDFAVHWYACLRALGIRVRGLYCTKDTFVTTALRVEAKTRWLEAQTGVRYETLKRHYAKSIPPEGEEELLKFAVEDPDLFGNEQKLSLIAESRRDNFQKRLVNRGAFECEEGDLNPHER